MHPSSDRARNSWDSSKRPLKPRNRYLRLLFAIFSCGLYCPYWIHRIHTELIRRDPIDPPAWSVSLRWIAPAILGMILLHLSGVSRGLGNYGANGTHTILFWGAIFAVTASHISCMRTIRRLSIRVAAIRIALGFDHDHDIITHIVAGYLGCVLSFTSNIVLTLPDYGVVEFPRWIVEKRFYLIPMAMVLQWEWWSCLQKNINVIALSDKYRSLDELMHAPIPEQN